MKITHCVFLISIFILSACPVHSYEGTIEHLQVTSNKLSIAESSANREVSVYLPDGYESSSKRYPVLYLLHGGWWMGLDNTVFLGKGYNGHLIEANAPKISDNLIRKGNIKPMIIVIPHISTKKPPSAPIYFPMVSDYLTKEIIPLIDRKYRTISSRKGRAISGHSDGADGAVFVAVSHPDLFSSVGAYAGVGLQIQGIDAKELLDSYDKKKHPLNFCVYVGQNDQYGNLSPTRKFITLLESDNILHTYIEDIGDHNSMIAQRLEESMVFFSEKMTMD